VLVWVGAKAPFGLLPGEGGYLINGPLVQLSPISMEIRLEPSVGPAGSAPLNRRTELLLC
jgi:hypothetical protein